MITSYLRPEHLAYLEKMESENLHLECDGLTTCISQWLWESGITHQRNAGMLLQQSTNKFIHHWWISFPDGVQLCFRSRMWFGETAPHGLFTLPVEGFTYTIATVMPPVQARYMASLLLNSAFRYAPATT